MIKGEIKSNSQFSIGNWYAQQWFYPESVKQIVNVILCQALGTAGSHAIYGLKDRVSNAEPKILCTKEDPYGEEDWGELSLDAVNKDNFINYLSLVDFKGVKYE